MCSYNGLGAYCYVCVHTNSIKVMVSVNSLDMLSAYICIFKLC